MRKRMMYLGLGLFLFCLVSQQTQAELISEWKFDGDARDGVGNNHGKIIGSPTWSADRFGDQNKSLALNGEDQHVNCGTDASLSFGNGTTDKPFSITWWQKSNIVPNLPDGKGFSVLNKVGEYYVEWSNAFRFHLSSENGSIGRATGVDIKQHQWTHIVVTYDGSRTSDGIKFYQDGESVLSKQEDEGIYTGMTNKGGVFSIGRRSPIITFNGLIDDFRIYNHVLSLEEVKALYLQKPSSVPLSINKSEKVITIQQISEAPLIDGNLLDKAWKEAEWHSNFHIFGHPEQIAKPKTSFAMVHDNENLYIGVRADELEPTKMKTLVNKRDGHTWNDDSIEIFLDSEGEGIFYYHFVINAKGVLYDSQTVRGGVIQKEEWNSDAKVATKIGDDAWFLELLIPFSCLSFKEPSFCRINVTRSRFVTSERGLFTFAPVKGTFHNSENFMLASLKDIDLTPFLLNFYLETTNFFPQGGQLISEARFLVKNYSSVPRELSIKATLKMGDKEISTILPTIKLKETYQGNISFPVPDAGKGILHVALEDKKLKKIVCSRQFPVAVDYTPLKVEVLQPHYQNAIFFGQKLENIELEVITALAPKERKDYLFEFSLNLDKESLCSQSVEIKEEKMDISIPLPRIETGKYLMKGALVHKLSGKILVSWQDVLYKLPSEKGEVRFDENMVCLIDNKPFLPFGLFNDVTQPKGLIDAVELGCNAIDYSHWPESFYYLLDEIKQSGIKVLLYPNAPGVPVACGKAKGLDKPLTGEQEESLRSYIREIKDLQPPLLAWYIGNEPSPPEVSVNTMKQIDSIIGEEDPYHPTTIISFDIKDISYYEPAMSLIMPDPYPEFVKNGGWRKPDFTTYSVKEAVKVSKGRKPVWVTMQAHDLTLFGVVDRRSPSFIDLRNQMYQAVIAGAKGFFWYCRYWIEPSVEIGISYLAKEAQLLREAIFAQESSHKFTAVKDMGEYGNLHISSRQVGENFYFFVVNGSDKKREITFNAEGLKDGKLFVVAEAREVIVTADKFTDFLKPFDTHIYTTDKIVANQLNIADVYKKIEVNCTSIIKPGNVAYKNYGATVKSSWVQNEWNPPLNFVIDGIKGTSSWGDAEKQPSWVDVTFPNTERICKVVIDSNIRHLQVEVEKNGTWLKVADVKAKRPDRREVQTIKFPLVETMKLRVQSMEVKGGVAEEKAVQTQIWEIEAYGEDKS